MITEYSQRPGKNGRQRTEDIRKVSEAKRTHWQNYVSSQTRNKMDSWGGVYKFLRGKRGPTDLP